MTLRRRRLVGCGRRPTVGGRSAYNVQAAGSTAQWTDVCYPCSALVGQQVWELIPNLPGWVLAFGQFIQRRFGR